MLAHDEPSHKVWLQKVPQFRIWDERSLFKDLPLVNLTLKIAIQSVCMALWLMKMHQP